MSVTDFSNSYMTFYSRGNIARILIDAACTLTDDETGSSQDYYLIAPCRGERMYLTTQLSQEPGYEFGGIFSRDGFALLRTRALATENGRELGSAPGRLDKVDLSIRTYASAHQAKGEGEVVEATLSNVPLVGRTELSLGSNLRAVLQYPVKTMNIARNPARFQVDTGPLLWAGRGLHGDRALEELQVAHVLYNTFDRAEFVAREAKEMSVGDTTCVLVTDYGPATLCSATNSIWVAA